MKGSFELADLQIILDGSIKELAQAQGVEREFRRACRRLRAQSGADEVFFRVDTGLEGQNGTFHKFRLRAYAPNSPEIYTIDCGITDENPLGIYVGWNAPIEIYNRETEQVRTIDPETGEVSEGRGNGTQQSGDQQNEAASNPSSDGRASSTRQNGQTGGRPQHESQKVYDQSSQSAPTKEQAADALVAEAQKHPEDTLAFGCQVNGTMLDEKLKGLAEYCGRDHGYMARVLDALQLQSLGQVAVGQVQTVANMMLDEEVLRENESYEPDDQLPF